MGSQVRSKCVAEHVPAGPLGSLQNDIEAGLQASLLKILKACGFEIQDTSDCRAFLNILHKFIKYLSGVFAEEINKQLNHPDNKRSRGDLISWTLAEVRLLQLFKLKELESFIVISELKQSGINSIDCGTASSYTFRLSEFYKAADSEWKSNHQIEPASPKHQKKRKSRSWAPYFVTLWFKLDDE